MGTSTVVDMRLRIKQIGIDSPFSVDIGAGEYVGIACSSDSSGLAMVRIVQSTFPFGYD
jgi:hypothetical protein